MAKDYIENGTIILAAFINDLEERMDKEDITDEEWDEVYENVIDPLNRALSWLESNQSLDSNQDL